MSNTKKLFTITTESIELSDFEKLHFSMYVLHFYKTTFLKDANYYKSQRIEKEIVEKLTAKIKKLLPNGEAEYNKICLDGCRKGKVLVQENEDFETTLDEIQDSTESLRKKAVEFFKNGGLEVLSSCKANTFEESIKNLNQKFSNGDIQLQNYYLGLVVIEEWHKEHI